MDNRNEVVELLESVLNEAKHGNAWRRAAQVAEKELDKANQSVKAQYRDAFKKLTDLKAQAQIADKAGDKDEAKKLRMEAIKIGKQLKELEQKNHDISTASLVNDIRKDTMPAEAKEVGKRYAQSKANKAPNAKINAMVNRNTAHPGSYTTEAKMEAAQILVEAIASILSE